MGCRPGHQLTPTQEDTTRGSYYFKDTEQAGIQALTGTRMLASLYRKKTAAVNPATALDSTEPLGALGNLPHSGAEVLHTRAPENGSSTTPTLSQEMVLLQGLGDKPSAAFLVGWWEHRPRSICPEFPWSCLLLSLIRTSEPDIKNLFFCAGTFVEKPEQRVVQPN